MGVKHRVTFSSFKTKKIKIFDITTQPMLTYSSEIWGTVRLDNMETVHMMACKHVLGDSPENTEQDGVW